MSDGSVRVGGVLSTTVTLKEEEAVRPALSLTVQVTVVEPGANVEPDEGVQVGVKEPSTESDAVAVNMTVAPFGPVALTVISDGTVIAGGVSSTTVTLNDADAELPAMSVAEHVTLVDPTGNVEPEAGVQVTGTEPSTRSDAEAVKVTTAPLELVALTVMSPGTVTTGGVLS
jgi:hypothetical protein